MRKGKVFYTIYFVCIGLFLVGMTCVVVKLYRWLVNYEASQPTAKCAEVFAELFESPDWAKIYELSGTEDTVFEGKDSYVAYMTAKVGDEPLTLSETSAGLSGNKKYVVKLGEEKLLSFTLVSSEGEKGITRWSLGEIALELNRGTGVRIQKNAEDTVYLNGVRLGEEYTVQRTETLAETYLPEGIHSARTEIQCVEGLLMPPSVMILNAEEEEQLVYYDEENGIYVEEQSAADMPEEDRQTVLSIAQGYCEYMIGAARGLSNFFDPDTEIYQTIRKNESWMQDYRGYSFEGNNVTDYCRYSDSLFTVRVTLSLNVERKNGSVKEYALDASFFIEKQADGKYRAVNMTNVDVMQPVTQVRLVYRYDGQVLQDQFEASDTRKLSAPVVQAPEGKKFSGWMRETVDDLGRTSGELVFVPDEDGNVTLPEGYRLEPMTLYPLFE